MTGTWTGLRPFSADGLPYIGRVDERTVVCAGHGSEGILKYTEEELVSSDYIGNPHSCILDAKSKAALDVAEQRNGRWFDPDLVRALREAGIEEISLHTGQHYDANHVTFERSLDGANWQPFQLNLPIVPVTDLTIKDKDLVVPGRKRVFYRVVAGDTLEQVAGVLGVAPADLADERPVGEADGIDGEVPVEHGPSPVHRMRFVNVRRAAGIVDAVREIARVISEDKNEVEEPPETPPTPEAP